VAFRLLDTNIVSFILNGHTLAAAYQPHLSGYDLAISFQTIAELVAGGVLAGWGDARWAALNAVLAPMTVLHSDQAVCERWAEVWVVRRSQPIGVADCWIAATALAFGLELVPHNPADFQGIPGLVIITEAP
jgi:tRNA(fMet)-specific endonuclease VapC